VGLSQQERNKIFPFCITNGPVIFCTRIMTEISAYLILDCCISHTLLSWGWANFDTGLFLLSCESKWRSKMKIIPAYYYQPRTTNSTCKTCNGQRLQNEKSERIILLRLWKKISVSNFLFVRATTCFEVHPSDYPHLQSSSVAWTLDSWNSNNLLELFNFPF
jgi:hypothetical protein